MTTRLNEILISACELVIAMHQSMRKLITILYTTMGIESPLEKKVAERK